MLVKQLIELLKTSNPDNEIEINCKEIDHTVGGISKNFQLASTNSLWCINAIDNDNESKTSLIVYIDVHNKK